MIKTVPPRVSMYLGAKPSHNFSPVPASTSATSSSDVLRRSARNSAMERRARDAVWNLRRKEEEEIDLSYSLAALAEQSTRAFGIPVVCERVDPMSGISGSTGHELLMVAREAIRSEERR